MTNSWGNYPTPQHKQTKSVLWRDQLALFDQLPVLPYGNGRSYGDQCLNKDGTILQTKTLNRFIAFDKDSGVLRCEAGTLLTDILAFAVPQGWTLPVVPGTQFITVGGAIANDVHGKNHHVRGTFGQHVKQFELLRSDGCLYCCSPTDNAELFQATIAGLGLTGLILTADIQLIRQASQYLTVDTHAFDNLETFFTLSQQAKNDYEYTVAWLDCQASGKQLGRGLFMQANYTQQPYTKPYQAKAHNVPCFLPSFALNPLTVRAFNHYYFSQGEKNSGRQIVHYQPYFFPLDSIHHWNRIYGKHGFLQFQCVVPLANGLESITKLLQTIVQSKQGSFLSVLKIFGDQASPGLMSFPMPGITLALDFPQRGEKTFTLLHQLDEIVMQANGRVYMAKDANMKAKYFNHYYQHALEQFKRHKDPGFCSDLWRRMVETT
ncbi:MAG: FAD-binding oxidoreductase [Coxiellaceae bacterium]|nr:FAD-binding oxidoreductase [Coxiellaceae bacterium]